MNSVRDGADVITRKHSARNLAVAHGDPVHVAGEAQRQIGHVQRITFPRLSLIKQGYEIARQHLHCQATWKLIVSSWHRRMRRKNAHFADAIDVELL